MVGAYLPESADDPGFHVFKASVTRTPALRAGAYTRSLLSST